MSDVQKLQELLDEIPYAVLIEVQDCMWYRDHNRDEIYWNGEFNSEDLHRGEGDTYSGWMRESSKEWEGYLVTNLDMSIGTMVTYLFPLEKEVKWEDLEEICND